MDALYSSEVGEEEETILSHLCEDFDATAADNSSTEGNQKNVKISSPLPASVFTDENRRLSGLTFASSTCPVAQVLPLQFQLSSSSYLSTLPQMTAYPQHTPQGAAAAAASTSSFNNRVYFRDSQLGQIVPAINGNGTMSNSVLSNSSLNSLQQQMGEMTHQDDLLSYSRADTYTDYHFNSEKDTASVMGRAPTATSGNFAFGLSAKNAHPHPHPRTASLDYKVSSEVECIGQTKPPPSMSEENQKLMKENQALRQSFTSIQQGHVDDKEQVVRKWKSEVESREVELRTLREFIRTSTNNSFDTSQLSTILSTARDKEQQIAKLEKDNARLNSSMATAEEQMKQSQQSAEVSLLQVGNERRQVEERLSRTIEEITRENSLLKHEVAELRQEQGNEGETTRRVKEVEGNCEALLNDVNQLNEELVYAYSQLEEQRQINGKLQEDLEKKKSLHSEVSSEVTDMLVIMEKKTAELEEQKTEQLLLLEQYKEMTEQSQAMNLEYLHINQANVNKIEEMEVQILALHKNSEEKQAYFQQTLIDYDQEKDTLMSENTALVLELKRLSSAHQSELDELRDAKQLKNRVEELTSLLRESENSKLHITNSFDQMQYEFEHSQKSLISQLDEERQTNLQQIQQLKVEITQKADNFLQLQELDEERNHLLEQLEQKEQTFQQTCVDYEERLTAEINAHTYQLNHQLTNLKQAMRELEEDHNAMRINNETAQRETERLRTRVQELSAEKEQLSSQYERQITQIQQQHERTAQSLRVDKDRDVVFLQREVQRLAQLLQEKTENIAKLDSIVNYSNTQAQGGKSTAASSSRIGGSNSNSSVQPYQFQTSIGGNHYSQQPQHTSNHMNRSQTLQTHYPEPNDMMSNYQSLPSSVARRNTSLSNLSTANIHQDNSFSSQSSSNTDHIMSRSQTDRGTTPAFTKQAQSQHMQLMQRQDYRQPQVDYRQPLSSLHHQQQQQQQQQLNTTTSMSGQNGGYESNSSAIMDENDMLNKMILERCRNIVEGKVVVAAAAQKDNKGSISKGV